MNSGSVVPMSVAPSLIQQFLSSDSRLHLDALPIRSALLHRDDPQSLESSTVSSSAAAFRNNARSSSLCSPSNRESKRLKAIDIPFAPRGKPKAKKRRKKKKRHVSGSDFVNTNPSKQRRMLSNPSTMHRIHELLHIPKVLLHLALSNELLDVVAALSRDPQCRVLHVGDCAVVYT